jgi:ParB/RepB/Spo0J family partition protein
MKINEKLTVAVNAIVADSDIQAREDYRGIEKLATNIKTHGLLQPLVVERIKDAEEGATKLYKLLAGFRRYMALTSIGAMEAPVTVVDIKITKKDPTGNKARLMANTIENMQREDLSTFETAQRFNELKGEGFSGQAIANQVNKSVGYVNNMTRSISNLHPDILAEWKEDGALPVEKRNVFMTTNNLKELATEKNQDQQLHDWYTRQGLEVPAEVLEALGLTGDDGDDTPVTTEENPTPDPAKKERTKSIMSKAEITEKLAEIKEGKKSAENKAYARALKWVIMENKNLDIKKG